jgi:hypothetical protein
MKGGTHTSDAEGSSKESARTESEHRHFMVKDIQHVADSCKTR